MVLELPVLEVSTAPLVQWSGLAETLDHREEEEVAVEEAAAPLLRQLTPTIRVADSVAVARARERRDPHDLVEETESEGDLHRGRAAGDPQFGRMPLEWVVVDADSESGGQCDRDVEF